MPQLLDWLRRVIGQVRGFLAAMPLRQRLVFLGATVVFVVGFAAFVWWASQPVFDDVYASLGEADAAAIVEHLKSEKIPYRLERGGRAVLVPADRVHDVRLALAQAGLPQGGGVGFEIFDQQKLGMTDFLQRLNYTRALQGELARTITQIAGVSAARVHLALPERSVFVDEKRRPSASVTLTLAPGRALGASQVAAIVHLVASSVEGLSPDQVAVVDNSGRVLAGTDEGIEAGGVGNKLLEYQRGLERGLEERIESMLGRVVGRDKVNARVSVQLDLTQKERTEQRVDPDQTAVLNERVSREESTDAAAAGGPPGIADNLTNETAPVQGARMQRRDESVTYEVTKITSRTVGHVGQVERLSVAVLVDGTYETRDGAVVFVPRPAEEIGRYTDLVKSAVGFSEARGDRVEVASVPFQAPAPTDDGWLDAVARGAHGVGVYLPRLLGVGLLLLFFLVVARPALRQLASRAGAARLGETGEPLLGGGSAIEALMDRLEGENRRLTAEHPERAAYLVRQWLQTRE
jgi:flagellar M-ring protein FliF